MRTTNSTNERTERSRGLQFTMVEEVKMERNESLNEIRIHDAEGVVVTVGDEIEMLVQSEPSGGPAQESRTFGRVLEVRTEATVHKPAAVIVGWNHNQRVGEVDPVVFEHFCRILVSVGGESVPAGVVAGTEPVTFNVGDGATAIGWSDCRAGTIIEASAKRVVWQRDKVKLLNRDELKWTPGGFAGHCEGVQRYSYEADSCGRIVVYTLRKNGRWIPKGAPLRSTAQIVPGRTEHYDYNF